MESVRSTSPAYLSVLRPGRPAWKSLFTKRRGEDPTRPFQYRPLSEIHSEIRLVTVISRSHTKGGILECEVEHVSLDENVPPYAALSYVWGDPARTVAILLNGHSHAITENLAVALRHLQHERKSLLLWIDAICINQDDHNEKGFQVQRMGKIYSEAAVVLSWLGPEDHPSTIAMTKLSRLNQYFEDNFPVDALPASMDTALWAPIFNNWMECSFANLKPGNDHESDVPYACIVKFLSRPYWSRLWTQQESGLGKETIFVCGRQDMTKETLMTGVDVSIQLATRFSDGWNADLKSASDDLLYETGPAILMFYRNGTEPLKELLYRATLPRPGGAFRASDRRDMIYGLLAMSSDANVLRIRPNYSKAWQDVYREVTETYVKQGDLSILSFAGLSPAQPDLPSWVPDWSQLLSDSPVSRHGKLPGRLDAVPQPFYSAAISSRCHFSIPQPGILNLSGYHVDVISHIGSRFSAHQNPDEHSELAQVFPVYSGETVKELWGNREPKTSPYGDGQMSDWVAALFCALVAGTQSTEYQDQRGRGYLRWLPGCDFDRVVKKVLNDEVFDEDAWYETWKAYIKVVKEMDRLPFVTANGFVGVGPPHLFPGDEICICDGASVPFAIRKNFDETTYELLGDVYVHGIMYGEFLTSRPEPQMFSFS